jgi:hypothetical protein
MLKGINQTTVHLRLLTLYTNHPFTEGGSDLRRAITAAFSDIAVLHNHNGSGFDYRSPRVRYLVIDQVPHLISFEDGLKIVERIYREQTALRCGARVYRVTGTELLDIHDTVGICGELYHYQSQTPWLALNEENHGIYMKLSHQAERSAMLERIMTANMIALSKNIELDVQEKIMVKMLAFDDVRLKAGKTPMLGFHAQFVTNFRIPAFVGVGKMVSKGFGLFGDRQGMVQA